MPRDLRYKSSIPSNASQRIVGRFDDGRKEMVECFVNRKLVGRRQYDEDGCLCVEKPLKDGKIHGVLYQWDFDGTLSDATPYRDGKPHGVARQWSASGRLMGKYKMTHGTGIDLWWSSIDPHGWEGPFFLAEVHYEHDGVCHGYSWWINEDQQTISVERHFLDGSEHGIFREWNEHGRLMRGFPKYFVNGAKVVKRQYIRAAGRDKSLPPFREEDNGPSRGFPTEIAKKLLKQEDA